MRNPGAFFSSTSPSFLKLPAWICFGRRSQPNNAKGSLLVKVMCMSRPELLQLYAESWCILFVYVSYSCSFLKLPAWDLFRAQSTQHEMATTSARATSLPHGYTSTHERTTLGMDPVPCGYGLGGGGYASRLTAG
jgi:hypothetical protein